jgi:hypothetical protein
LNSKAVVAISHEATFIVFIGERIQQLSTEKTEKISLCF